jgi:hypothetical protein
MTFYNSGGKGAMSFESSAVNPGKNKNKKNIAYLRQKNSEKIYTTPHSIC